MSKRRVSKVRPTTVRPDFTFHCPFCGLEAGIDLRNVFGFHSLPMCATFEGTDLVTYMQRVNDALEAAKKSRA